MEYLFSNEYDRISVLKYLDCNNKKWIQSERIAAEVKLSKSSVSKTVTAIKDLIHSLNLEGVVIDSGTNKGIYFERNRRVPLHILIENIYTESLSFIIIDALLNEKIRSLNQFAMDNYISIASLRRKIQALNDILKEKDIAIKRNRLVGNEYNVRAFLFGFYWEIFRGTNWPFPSTMKKNFEAQANYIEPQLKLWINESSKEQIYYFLSISEIRELKGHSVKETVEKDEEVKGLSISNPLYLKQKEIKTATNRFKIFPEEVYQYVYYVINSFSLDYRKCMTENIQNLWNIFKEQNTISVKIAEKTLSTYNSHTGSKLTEEEFIENVLSLCMIHHKAHILSDNSFYRNADSLKEIKRFFPNLYAAIEATIDERLSEYPDVKYNKMIIMEEYALMIYDSINLGLYSYEINVALNMSGGFRSEKKLEDQLLKRFGDRLSLKFVSPNEKHDILITDTQVIFGESNSPVYIEENRLTDADLDYLKELFEKLKVG